MNDSRALITALMAGMAVLLVGVVLIIAIRGLNARTMEQRLTRYASAGSASGTEPSNDSTLSVLQELVARVGQAVRARTQIYSEKDIAALEGLIASSGFKPSKVLPILLGLKVILLIGIPSVALLYGQAIGLATRQQVMLVLVALPVGMLGPDYVIAYLRKPFAKALQRGVPDALDLLVVCSEAGMGLESGLEHVSQEMRHSNAPMAQALSSLLDDLRILPDRKEAFTNFADRTGVDGARRVASMMAQSLQYGTPLSQALRTVANDLRRERMMALESKAAKLPVLLTLPLILFIKPSLFIVLLGPAFIGMGDTITRSIGK